MKTCIVVTVEGGIVQSVDSNVPAEVLVLDIDPHSVDNEYSFSGYQTNPGEYPEVLKSLSESLTMSDKLDGLTASDVDDIRRLIEKVTPESK